MKIGEENKRAQKEQERKQWRQSHKGLTPEDLRRAQS